MKNSIAIGLNFAKAKQLAQKLNVLFANNCIFYQKVRGYHWNIKGEKFFELHVKFKELYTDLKLKIDEIAERIPTLGYSPEHSYSNYKKESTVGESSEVSDGIKAVNDILKSFQVIIGLERALLSLAADAEDEGTNALMSDYIRTRKIDLDVFSLSEK